MPLQSQLVRMPLQRNKKCQTDLGHQPRRIPPQTQAGSWQLCQNCNLHPTPSLTFCSNVDNIILCQFVSCQTSWMEVDRQVERDQIQSEPREHPEMPLRTILILILEPEKPEWACCEYFLTKTHGSASG